MKLAGPLRRGEQPEPSPDGTMTLTEHLGELRQRIIRASLAVIVGMIAILAFYDQVLAFLLEPYERLCKSNPDFCPLTSEGGVPSLIITDPVEGLEHAHPHRHVRRSVDRPSRDHVADLAASSSRP